MQNEETFYKTNYSGMEIAQVFVVLPTKTGTRQWEGRRIFATNPF